MRGDDPVCVSQGLPESTVPPKASEQVQPG
jgi:hypothetical protein